MSCDQSYPMPQVFLVDGGGGAQPPNLVPCWSFLPTQERMRSRGKSRSCMGISPSLAMVTLLLFLLVFTALGFEAYQIMEIQKKMKVLQKVETEPLKDYSAPLKQIGSLELHSKKDDMNIRPAAHVIGRIESEFKKTLRWNAKSGQAFTSGGVSYHPEDGCLQVNETGLYQIYSRVELIFNNCSPTSSFEHCVFVRRAGNPSPLTLMEDHRAGFCPLKATHSWTTESFLGSAMQLQKDDRVFVNVSHPAFLSHSHHANFFGLYKI